LKPKGSSAEQALDQPGPRTSQTRRRVLLLVLGLLTLLLIIGSARLLLPHFSVGDSAHTAFGAPGTAVPTARRSPMATHSPPASSSPGHGTPAPGGTSEPGATPPSGASATPGSKPTNTPSEIPTVTPSPTTVAAPPQLAVTPRSLQFSLTLVGCLSQPPSQTLTIQNTGAGTLFWQASLQNATYLSIAPTNGSLGPLQSNQMTVSILCPNAPLSTTDTIYVTSNGGNLSISVMISLL